MKKATIICRNTSHGTHTFYLKVDGEEYFLFSQTYRRGVADYYRRDLPLDRALDHGRSKGNTMVTHTMDKLPAYIRYLEQEYDLAVLEKTRKARQAAGCRV